jgi:hypothetical protein
LDNSDRIAAKLLFSTTARADDDPGAVGFVGITRRRYPNPRIGFSGAIKC